jgi:rhodanese-related sulfurtransferase
VALLLKKRGITRVRPLEGGLDAWKEAGYPLDEFEPQLVKLTSIQT